MRSGAKRLIQIAMLERQLESEQTRNQTMVEELVKQTQMMDRVLNFRDQECARDTTELLHENAEHCPVSLACRAHGNAGRTVWQVSSGSCTATQVMARSRSKSSARQLWLWASVIASRSQDIRTFWTCQFLKTAYFH